MPKKINGPVDPVVSASSRLGVTVRDAFRKGTGLPYSTYIGSKALDYRNDLGGLNLSTVPKIFLECGNMRNPTEAAKFQDPRSGSGSPWPWPTDCSSYLEPMIPRPKAARIRLVRLLRPGRGCHHLRARRLW